MRMPCTLVLIIVLVLASPLDGALAAERVDFEREIRPILVARCQGCHGGVHRESGFSALSREALLAENDSGVPAVVPGSSRASELIRRISSADDDERMPPDAPLGAAEIERLMRWVDEDAEWPTLWSLRPIAPPELAHDHLHPIDELVRRHAIASGLEPSPPAPKRVLIRRLSLDLVGLVPTAAEVRDFEENPSPNAYGQLVDRLLASPHFGERWARHWLDEARYADSEGYEKDSPKADAYRFRDWVINTMNDDLPFDWFTRLQIAGDLIPLATPEHRIATQFHLQAQFNLEGGVDPEEDRIKRVVDQVNTIGTTWLGTTIGCCQCHDHPYDAWSQRDYYGLFAFFNNTDIGAEVFTNDSEFGERVRAERAQRVSRLTEILIEQQSNKNVNDAVQHQWMDLRNFDNSNEFVRILVERTTDRRTTYVLHRGDFQRPRIQDGEVLARPLQPIPPVTSFTRSLTRWDLANWLIHPDNPLTPRVAVNKVWAHLMGVPLVEQPGDFGSRGQPPRNPELVDWLAHELVHGLGWSRKRLIKSIVMSKTYRQASDVAPRALELDPNNALFLRQSRFRVDAEVLRDICLQVSGLLSNRIGGPSVYPPLPQIIAMQTYANSYHYRPSTGEDRYRRGLYTHSRRTASDPNLTTFDCPDASVAVPRRARSNNPLQALALLQNEVFHESVQAFARRILHGKAEFDHSDDELLNAAYRIALSRLPTAEERSQLLDLLRVSQKYYHDHPQDAKSLVGNYVADGVALADHAAWTATLRVIINLDEFVTRP